MFDLILIFIFLGSTAAVFTVVSRKVPAIVAIPEGEIQKSFAASPSRLTKAAALLRPFLARATYENTIVLYLEKILRRVRIWILKSDTFVSKILVRIQERSRTIAERDSQYWQGLKDWKKEQKETVVPITSLPALPAKNRTESVQKLFQAKSNQVEDRQDSVGGSTPP